MTPSCKPFLSLLEAQQTADNNGLQGQLALTVAEPEVADDPLRDMLDGLEPDAMTPREALDVLYRMKGMDKS